MQSQQPKKWYDDWELTVGGPSITPPYDLRMVTVHFPHSPADDAVFKFMTTADTERMAAILDKILCELTGTRPSQRTTEGKHLGPGI
jgi:hypothetical protein